MSAAKGKEFIQDYLGHLFPDTRFLWEWKERRKEDNVREEEHDRRRRSETLEEGWRGKRETADKNGDAGEDGNVWEENAPERNMKCEVGAFQGRWKWLVTGGEGGNR